LFWAWATGVFLIHAALRHQTTYLLTRTGLTLPKQLPHMAVQSRWYSEPLKVLSLPASSFLKNAKGYPVLSKAHQALITRYMRLRASPWLLLTDVGPIPGFGEPPLTAEEMESGVLSPGATDDEPAASPTPAEAKSQSQSPQKKYKDPTPHLSYIRHLQRNQPTRSPIERFGAGYQDYLQAPLQPLADNLESITYEVFEKDPIKYAWYEHAIARALEDWIAEGKQASSESGCPVVAVAGAGRGPLVTRALAAAESTGVDIELWAVEKNPNAYVVLQRHNEEDWDFQVKVIKSDMRAWRGPLRDDGSFGHVDILVSELLGSFADNELSPECLDGVQHVLNPVHGISIPSSYTAHMTPIAAPKLHSDILARAQSDESAHELPYVVMLHAIDYLSTLPPQQQSVAASGTSSITSSTTLKPEMQALLPDIKTAWEFKHPIPPAILSQSNLRRGGSFSGGSGGANGGDGANEHNERFAILDFQCAERGVCHGLGGYFETVLYANGKHSVELSTNPATMEQKSRDMISWFPIFFPLKVSLLLDLHPEISDSDVLIQFRNPCTSLKSPSCRSASGDKLMTAKCGTSGWLKLSRRSRVVREFDSAPPTSTPARRTDVCYRGTSLRNYKRRRPGYSIPMTGATILSWPSRSHSAFLVSVVELTMDTDFSASTVHRNAYPWFSKLANRGYCFDSLADI
jgi:type II protein arginine methyltransferase